MLDLNSIVSFLKSHGFVVIYQSFPQGFVGVLRYDDMVAVLDPDQVPYATTAVKALVELLEG